MKRTLLVVDDEVEVRQSLRRLLEDRYRILDAGNGAEALATVRRQGVDLLLLDFQLPDIDGLRVLDEVRAIDPTIDVIMVTATNDVPTAVRAMRSGAQDYVTKPYDTEELRLAVERVFDRRGLADEVAYLKAQVGRHGSAGRLVGTGPAMEAVRGLIGSAAKVNSTVLVTGETGTGKELCARAVHDGGSRATKPFITVACTAIPESLLESELFGHERGAFTGATSRKPGMFELAHGGTIFLDEIGDMGAGIQAKLLRVLQEREFTRVGGTHPLRVDVRVIAATNRDLESMCRTGEFREDLFYRLCVLPITMPPLRARRDDIPELAQSFLERFAREVGSELVGFEDDALELLKRYRWPGNVRELQNVVERMVVLIRGRKRVEARDIPPHLVADQPQDSFDVSELYGQVNLEEAEAAFSKALIQRALEETGGNYTRAAEILRTTRRIIKYKADKLGVAVTKGRAR